MAKITLEKNKLWIGVASILIAGILVGIFSHSLGTTPTPMMEKSFADKTIDEKRSEFISEKNMIIDEMKDKGMYRCCLEKPCMYCIEKSPKHGEGAACTCAQDVLDGVHPCGECIGEIMEGHGDPNLAKYFAKSIAHKVGEQHHEHLKEMMADMYDISVEEQE